MPPTGCAGQPRSGSTGELRSDINSTSCEGMDPMSKDLYPRLPPVQDAGGRGLGELKKLG
ncbi:hypothetical protein FCV25MIE_23023 [Fagus crenata]